MSPCYVGYEASELSVVEHLFLNKSPEFHVYITGGKLPASSEGDKFPQYPRI